MSKKKGNLIEQHVDKIVLGVIALLSLYLVWALVIRNPYGSASPARVDKLNQSKSEDLNRRLEGPSEWVDPARENQLARFEGLMGNSVQVVDSGLALPLPGTPREMIDEDRQYPVPEIAALSNVKVQAIRGAAYLPLEEVRPDLPYDTVSTELGDLDMVSVSARVDLQSLYRNFQQSFMGPRLKATWRDPGLATPVFARVDLQRRQLRQDGTWGEWQSVSRPKIDPYRKQIDEMPLQVDQMDYNSGVSLLVAQHRDPSKQISLLQPRAYDFATWKVPYWLPPEFYQEYENRIQRQLDEQRRSMREGNTGGGMEAGGAGREQRRGREPQPPGREVRRGGVETPGGMPGAEAGGMRANRAPAPEEVLRDVSQVMITNRTNLWTLSDAMVWAHDDTTVPGTTYQYRMRLGVFNPIAGKNWFLPEQQEYQNQVVLWSSFSEPTSEVAIGKMLQVFPMTEIAEQPGALEVEVARFYMGKWQSHEFTVYPGQMVGAEVEQEAPAVTAVAAGGANPRDMGRGGMGMGGGMDITRGAPQMPMGMAEFATSTTVDYSTGITFVDLMPMVEWSEPPTIRQRRFSVMMFTEGGSEIEKLPIGNRNWPSDMQREYTSIKSAERDAREMQYLPRPTNTGGTLFPANPMNAPTGRPGRMGEGRRGMM